MSRAIEDRLVAALEARAELVRAEDLRPLGVPSRPRKVARAGVLLLAAAACAAVVAAPFAIGGLKEGAPSPDPVAPPSGGWAESHSPRPAQPETPSSSWRLPSDSAAAVGRFRVLATQHADLDGDGRRDRVRVMARPTLGTTAGVKLDADLAGRRFGTELFRSTEWAPTSVFPAVDLNGEGRQQLLYLREEGGTRELMVLGWDAHLHAPGWLNAWSPEPLVAGSDRRGRRTGFYVDAEGLHSWRTVEPLDSGGSTKVDVEVWSWEVRYDLPVEQSVSRHRTVTRRIGSGLVPTSEGIRCADVSTDEAEPC